MPVTTIANRSIGGIPQNITHVYRDDNLESTRGTRLQVNSINGRIWVVDVTPSKAAKTLGGRVVNGTFIRRGWDLENEIWRQARISGKSLLMHGIAYKYFQRYRMYPRCRGLLFHWRRMDLTIVTAAIKYLIHTTFVKSGKTRDCYLLRVLCFRSLGPNGTVYSTRPCQ